jgi:hypothetical protein
VYVMVWVPTPAVAGLKTPNALTPGPVQVPPAVSGVRVEGASDTQSVVGPQTEALQQFAASGAHAEAAKDWTPPLRILVLDVPVPPQAITSPEILTSTSNTLKEVG